MGKHAYLILCHNDRYCLETLVRMLDDERSDIFILPDKKSDCSLTSGLTTEKSILNIIPVRERIDVRWGDLSQIKAELKGFRYVLENGEYDYIHLLSGQDLPIKSQDYIHSFFEKNWGKNYIGFAQGEHNKHDVEFKTRFYFLLTRYYKSPHRFIRKCADTVRSTALRIQRYLGFHRKWEIPVFKGANWVSITNQCAEYLVSKEREILKMFKGSFCADELYKQTMVMNSPLRDTIADESQDFACGTRLIDWKRGKPYVWREEDFDELMNSEALFARKFSSAIDKKIIDEVKEKVLGVKKMGGRDGTVLSRQR